jgi:uncharacterized membrane protein
MTVTTDGRRRGPRTRRASGTPLDQPLERGLSLRPSYDPERFGRLSERIARYIGSWKFIAWMTVAIVAWILWNVLAPEDLKPDPFPFIFLTLLLSLQASYAAPLILLAQNRQADRDRVEFMEDRGRGERMVADTEYLAREIAALRLAIGEVATRDYVRGELRELLEEIDGRWTPDMAQDGGQGSRGTRR